MLGCTFSFIHLLFSLVKMEEDELKKYMLKIGDLVLDEDKIVTYKFLSRTLDIHVNTAKQLLHTFFLQQQKVTPGIVSATYLVAGLLKDGSFVVSIVNGDSLNEAYLKFDVITSEHVYSIQKGKGSNIERNSEALYIVDSKLHHKGWVIKCDETPEEDAFESNNNSHTENVEKAVSSNVSVETEVQNTEEKCEKKVKVTGITKFFENSQSKENGFVKKSPQKDKKRNSIAHFFNNHSQRKKLNVEESIEEMPENSKSSVNKGESSRNIDEIDLEQMSMSEKAGEEKKVIEKGRNKSKNVEKRRGKSGDSKKRKRIISDSEESESDEEEQDAMLCTETEVSQNVERVNRFDDDDDDDIFRHKKKKKKFVDKTILREDGYMETIKEIVYETDSESESQPKKEIKIVENEVLPKSSKPQETIKTKSTASKSTANSKPKQQTLLSFFKKN